MCAYSFITLFNAFTEEGKEWDLGTVFAELTHSVFKSLWFVIIVKQLGGYCMKLTPP